MLSSFLDIVGRMGKGLHSLYSLESFCHNSSYVLEVGEGVVSISLRAKLPGDLSGPVNYILSVLLYLQHM